MLQRSKSQGDKSPQKGINGWPTIWQVDLQNKKPKIPIRTFTKNSYWLSVPPTVVKINIWTRKIIILEIEILNYFSNIAGTANLVQFGWISPGLAVLLFRQIIKGSEKLTFLTGLRLSIRVAKGARKFSCTLFWP